MFVFQLFLYLDYHMDTEEVSVTRTMEYWKYWSPGLQGQQVLSTILLKDNKSAASHTIYGSSMLLSHSR